MTDFDPNSPLASLPSPEATQIYSINPDLNQERISELHLRRHREDHGDDDEKRRKQGAPATAKGHGSHRNGAGSKRGGGKLGRERGEDKV